MQSVKRSLNLLFQHTHFLMFSLFQKYFNPQVRTNKLVNSVVYHLCLSILASGIHPYFFKLLRFYLCPECLFSFLWLKYSTMCGKKFPIYGAHIRKWIESMHFYPVPHPKLQVQFFENLFHPRAKNKCVEKTMICFIKIPSENMKMTWNISLFICCMFIYIYSFSKCDCFTVLWIISVK